MACVYGSWGFCQCPVNSPVFLPVCTPAAAGFSGDEASEIFWSVVDASSSSPPPTSPSNNQDNDNKGAGQGATKEDESSCDGVVTLAAFEKW